MRIKLAFGIGCTVPIRWARNMMQVLCLHLCPKSESCMIASKNRRLCLCQNFSISITHMLPFMFLSKRKRPKSASKSACQVCVFLTFSHFSQWKPQSRHIVLLTALKNARNARCHSLNFSNSACWGFIRFSCRINVVTSPCAFWSTRVNGLRHDFLGAFETLSCSESYQLRQFGCIGFLSWVFCVLTEVRKEDMLRRQMRLQDLGETCTPEEPTERRCCQADDVWICAACGGKFYTFPCRTRGSSQKMRRSDWELWQPPFTSTVALGRLTTDRIL